MKFMCWNDAQYEQMSWHDNHVHGLRIVEGEHGSGDFVLDLDYILEWLKDGISFKFRMVPVTLRFHGVTNLRIALDYSSASAALGPFSIHVLERRYDVRERYTAQCWIIRVNWPLGEISFEALGYRQEAWGKVVVAAQQWLKPGERQAAE